VAPAEAHIAIGDVPTTPERQQSQLRIAGAMVGGQSRCIDMVECSDAALALLLGVVHSITDTIVSVISS